MLPRPLTRGVAIMPSFSAEAMVEATMSTRISGLLLSVRNWHASVKMATDPTLSLCRGGQRGGNHWPRSKEDIISLLSLYTLGQLDRLSSNRIHTLLWGFSARPSLLLLNSNCSVLLVLESKLSRFLNFAWKKFFVV